MADSNSKEQNIVEVELGELKPLNIIKTEANLAGLPFFALSRQDAKQTKEIRYTTRVERNRKALEVLWSVTPNVKYGCPGPFDRRVHKAIECLINERGLPAENPIPFSLYRLMRILGVKHSGKTTREIKEALKRIVHTAVDSEGTFFSKKKEQYISDSFHIYDRVIFREQTLPNGEIADTNYVFLSQWYLDSINAFYVKPIDFDYWRQLRSDIAGRLYELLGLKFHGVILNRRAYWRVEYRELCALLPIAPQKYLSDAKKCLASAHSELIETHFLAKAMWETPDDGYWFLLYYPGKRAREEVKSKAIQEELPLKLPASTEESAPSLTLSALTSEEQSLLTLLKNRKIGQKSALIMVKAYPERIRDKVDIFDWMLQSSREKIQSPTGFLRRMIEEDWPAPEGFISQVEQEAHARQAEARQQELQRQEDARRVAEAQVEQAREQRKATSPWKTLWEQITDELAQRIPRQSFSTWIQPLFIAELPENAVVLDCPSRFIKGYVEEKYRSLIEEAVRAVCGAERQVIFVCAEEEQQ